MGKETKIALPKLGESILSAVVVKWFKKVGDSVQEDEPLLEVTTDKVNSEIPSTVSGILKEILAKPDQEIQVGDPLAVITTERVQPVPEALPEAAFSIPKTSTSSAEMKGGESYFSPAVIRLAMQQGLSMDELAKIAGTGTEGRVSKRDLEHYLLARQRPASQPVQSERESGVEKVKMSNMRKAIAENMVKSFYAAPHATLITEVDVTPIVKYLGEIKTRFLEKHGFKLTISSFITKAIAEAVKAFPLINSSLDGDTIVVKRFVNIGIAVSVEQGIMVPVIKNCHSISLKEIAKALAQVAHKAREGELKVEDTKEGTITMTNFGMSGTLIGIPIIRYPEVAIIGIGAITKKVAVIGEDSFGVRSVVNISLTFDHRVIDGMYGCDFLNALKNHLENISLDVL